MRVKDADGKTREIDIFFDKVSTKGRPRKVFTEEGLKLVENLAGIMCTDEEIASILGCSRDLFYTEDNNELYRQAIKKGNAQSKQSLRRLQFKLAEKNATMAIWIGKQYLGQTDVITAQTTEDFVKNLDSIYDKLKNPAKNRTIEEMED
jgi:hypothetical protein